MRTDKRTFLFLLALTCCGILFYRVLVDPGNALGLVSHMVGLFFPFLSVSRSCSGTFAGAC